VPTIGIGVKGDLKVSSGSKFGNLPVGANNTVPTADSAQTLGLKYASVDSLVTCVGMPRRILTGAYWKVDIIVDKELIIEGTGELDLQGDAEAIITDNL
jgi:hypothetical protein